jgi:sulfatase maturation enzyme AslB (radical SAM superfamily)
MDILELIASLIWGQGGTERGTKHFLRAVHNPMRPRMETDQTPKSAAETRGQELFLVPLDNGCSLAYAPLRRVAFLVTPEGEVPGGADLGAALAGAQEPGQSIEEEPDTPRPTAVTLFLPTACSLRCTYCYAAAGDRPAAFMPLV